MARSARRPGRQAQVAGLLLSTLAGACASVGTPPGGPPDSLPPQIVHVSPESGSVVPKWNDDVSIQFDEVIDEQPGGTGGGGVGSGLEREVLLSPAKGGVRVGWHRSRVSVKPREGWKKRVYRLEILPGFVDMRRNRFDSTRVVIFTLGPEIGHARIGGIALKWIEQGIMARALIEAVPLPDSTGYLTLADSGGQFNLTNLQPGRYIVYATNDENNDHRRGLREAYDSTIVTVDSSTNVALFAFPHDTNPPRPRSASSVDSLDVRVEFNQALDPGTTIDTGAVHVLTLPDSTPLAAERVFTEKQFDSVTTAAAAARDTARAKMAHDTSAQPNVHPTVPPPPPPPPPAQPPRAAPARGGGPRQQPSRTHVDTALVRKLLAQRPIPSDKFVIRLARPLKPETRYAVRVRGATNLVGKKGDGDIGFSTPKATPVDTTHHAPRPAPPTPPPPP